MDKTKFVYVTYIKTTPEKLWDALIKPEFTQKYWVQMRHESDWKAGSPCRTIAPDGTVKQTGQVLEVDHPRKLVYTWRNETDPEVKAEGFSRVTYTLEKEGTAVKLTVLHEVNQPESKLLKSVSNGWPLVLASLKSLLETGEPLEETKVWKPGQCK